MNGDICQLNGIMYYGKDVTILCFVISKRINPGKCNRLSVVYEYIFYRRARMVYAFCVFIKVVDCGRRPGSSQLIKHSLYSVYVYKNIK